MLHDLHFFFDTSSQIQSFSLVLSTEAITIDKRGLIVP